MREKIVDQTVSSSYFMLMATRRPSGNESQIFWHLIVPNLVSILGSLPVPGIYLSKMAPLK